MREKIRALKSFYDSMKMQHSLAESPTGKCLLASFLSLVIVILSVSSQLVIGLRIEFTCAIPEWGDVGGIAHKLLERYSNVKAIESGLELQLHFERFSHSEYFDNIR